MLQSAGASTFATVRFWLVRTGYNKVSCETIYRFRGSLFGKTKRRKMDAIDTSQVLWYKNATFSSEPRNGAKPYLGDFHYFHHANHS